MYQSTIELEQLKLINRTKTKLTKSVTYDKIIEVMDKIRNRYAHLHSRRNRKKIKSSA